MYLDGIRDIHVGPKEYFERIQEMIRLTCMTIETASRSRWTGEFTDNRLNV